LSSNPFAFRISDIGVVLPGAGGGDQSKQEDSKDTDGVFGRHREDMLDEECV